MKSKTFLMMLWIGLLSIFLLAGCGGGNDDETAEATESGGGEVIATTPMPPFTIMTMDGSMMVTYPQTWAVSEVEGQIMVANTTDSLETAVPGAGQVRGSINVIADSALVIYGLEAGAAPGDVLAQFISLNNAETADQVTLGEPTAFDADGKQAVLASGTVTGSAGTLDILYIVVAQTGGYGVIDLRAPQGEIAQYEDAARTLAASLIYTAPAE